MPRTVIFVEIYLPGRVGIQHERKRRCRYLRMFPLAVGCTILSPIRRFTRTHTRPHRLANWHCQCQWCSQHPLHCPGLDACMLCFASVLCPLMPSYTTVLCRLMPSFTPLRVWQSHQLCAVLFHQMIVVSNFQNYCLCMDGNCSTIDSLVENAHDMEAYFPS